jgi:hypothetical protein
LTRPSPQPELEALIARLRRRLPTILRPGPGRIRRSWDRLPEVGDLQRLAADLPVAKPDLTEVSAERRPLLLHQVLLRESRRPLSSWVEHDRPVRQHVSRRRRRGLLSALRFCSLVGFRALAPGRVLHIDAQVAEGVHQLVGVPHVLWVGSAGSAWSASSSAWTRRLPIVAAVPAERLRRARVAAGRADGRGQTHHDHGPQRVQGDDGEVGQRGFHGFAGHQPFQDPVVAVLGSKMRALLVLARLRLDDRLRIYARGLPAAPRRGRYFQACADKKKALCRNRRIGLKGLLPSKPIPQQPALPA